MMMVTGSWDKDIILPCEMVRFYVIPQELKNQKGDF